MHFKAYWISSDNVREKWWSSWWQYENCCCFCEECCSNSCYNCLIFFLWNSVCTMCFGPLLFVFNDPVSALLASPLGPLFLGCIKNERRHENYKEKKTIWFSATRIFEDIPQTTIAIVYALNKGTDVTTWFSLIASALTMLWWVISMVVPPLFQVGKTGVKSGVKSCCDCLNADPNGLADSTNHVWWFQKSKIKYSPIVNLTPVIRFFLQHIKLISLRSILTSIIKNNKEQVVFKDFKSNAS